jgi:hypothetical protein
MLDLKQMEIHTSPVPCPARGRHDDLEHGCLYSGVGIVKVDKQLIQCVVSGGAAVTGAWCALKKLIECSAHSKAYGVAAPVCHPAWLPA